MNNRERFQAVMAFEPVDRPCHIEHGFWTETWERWRGEGLPDGIKMPDIEYLSDHPDLYDFFGLTRYSYMLRSQYLIDPEPETVIEETERWRLVRDALGRTIKYGKACASLPQFLDYEVKDLASYEALIERMPAAPERRYPKDWDALAAKLRTQQDYAIGTHMDGFFAYPRELMGVEHLMTAFYTDPDLMRRMIDERVEFYIRVYEKAIRETRPDFAFIWEDMSFCNGPLVSPDVFREFMLPAYKKLTGWLREMGVETVIVDSDGDIRLLIPLWLEGGVNTLLPFEVKAGMDVVKLGEEFPKLRLMGGIDKHALERGRKDIDAEVARVVPAMLKRGGYCVALDHWVHPEIPYENYVYFVEQVRKVGRD